LSSRPVWPDGYAARVLNETDSTNAEAARLAPGLTVPTWIMAHRQTAARGRRGRVWVSPEGNFAATLVMRVAGGPEQAALRSFVAALALSDVLLDVGGPHARIALKWPNDVLLNGGKVAGILLEGVGAGSGQVAIGIGVNLVAAPPAGAVETGAVAPVSLKGETGQEVGPEEFLTHLAARFAEREAVMAGHGFAPVREAWLSRAARVGETVVARTMSDTVEGRFLTLAGDGALVLATPGGERRIHAADVYW
jgi:BirA family biotin operon repressor/biotin-[acetyl-CoA-carboxylase] ligase